MKKLAKAAAILSAVLLLFALLVGALYRVFTDNEWVKKEYERIDIEAQSGYTPEQASYVLGAMMDYSIGSFDDLDKVAVEENGESVLFFNESELSHMVDVRALTTGVLKLGLAALILGLALFAFAFIVLTHDSLKSASRAFLIALGVLIVIIIALGIWMAIDFDSFWTMFHVVFLDLESSTFDPAVSRMINICPAELFSDIIKHFALITGLALIIPVGLAILFLCLKKRTDHTLLRKLGFIFGFIWLVFIMCNILTDLRAFILAGLPVALVGLACQFASAVRREK